MYLCNLTFYSLNHFFTSVMTINSTNQRLVLGYLLVTVPLLASCVTDSDSSQPITFDGSWETNGLNRTTINNLSTSEGFTYTATDSGLYRRKTEDTNSWNSLSLQQKDVLDIVFLPNNKWLAALRIEDFSEGIPSLYLSSNQGENWQSYMNNYGGENGKYTWVGAIATASKHSDTVFARVSGTTVAQTLNGGKTWKPVNGQWNYWGGSAVLMKADPYHKNRVWAGGANAFSLPYLLKSEDSGDTWNQLPILENTEAIVYDIATHPAKASTVLAGLGIIRKSTDGGQSWSTVNNEFGTLTFTHSARNPEVVYASGRNTDGTLFFAASQNFGDSWEIVEMSDSPAGVQVNDMVSVMEDGQEVLYLGTNNGVFSYRFEN